MSFDGSNPDINRIQRAASTPIFNAKWSHYGMFLPNHLATRALHTDIAVAKPTELGIAMMIILTYYYTAKQHNTCTKM